MNHVLSHTLLLLGNSAQWPDLGKSISITMKGMLGIFFFMGIFYALIMIFELVFDRPNASSASANKQASKNKTGDTHE